MKYMAFAAMSCLLVACGGSSDDTTTDRTDLNATDLEARYNKLTPADLSDSPLKYATEAELETLLKNGIRLSLRQSWHGAAFLYGLGRGVDDGVMLESSGVENAQPATASDATSNYSTTNVQVNGVDEADHIKYDGKHLFVSTWPQSRGDYWQSEAEIRILATDPIAATATEVATIPVVQQGWGGLSEMYLVQSEQAEAASGLATVRSAVELMYFDMPSVNSEMGDEAAQASTAIWNGPVAMERGVEVSIYDVTDPANPNKAWQLVVDGNLLGSRKIGNTLYLISNYYPHLPFPSLAAAAAKQKLEKEAEVAAMTIAELTPNYRINDGEPQSLVPPEGCLISADNTEAEGYMQLHTVTVVDLAAQQVVDTLCLNTQVYGLYSSLENLYLGGTRYGERHWGDSYTVLHKISLTDGSADYQATGSVPGSLGWSAPSFRMDEYQDDLRIVTSAVDDQWQPEHRLFVLRDSDASGQLDVVGQLPSDARPDPIGKPGEDIYSVRFQGDRGYIVTFQRTDPLYVLDLADPADPRIAGALELPGFSTYLHPIGDNYMFGFGQDADEAGRASGLKVSLFDVGNPAEPAVVNELTFGGRHSYSEAQYDHRALTFLASGDDQLRIAVPMTLHSQDSQTDWYYEWLKTGLELFEINGLAGTDAELTHVGSVTAESNSTKQHPSFYGYDRSVIHDEALFYIHGPEVWSSLWQTPETATGPQ